MQLTFLSILFLSSLHPVEHCKKMYLVVIISLLIYPINTIIISQVHRSSFYYPNSSCAHLSNVTLPSDASIRSCIWECAHQDQCRTAVYYYDNRTCSLFSDDCDSGNITSSGNIRASVICHRRNQGSSNQCAPPGKSTMQSRHIATQ